MTMHVDHVVLWVADPLRSVEFFERVVGLEGVRVAEFRAREAPFPSVRLSADTILDLMPEMMAARLNEAGAKLSPAIAASAGHRVHHICLAMPRGEYDALRERVQAHDGTVVPMQRMFGARGVAPEAFYFHDPDGNVFEARTYD
jgi:catechol 2,3-dioxygenase-like lactoylglutathione lyase family enzyme